MLVIGYSLLRGTETAICKPDNQSRELFCHPGTKIKAGTEKLTKTIKPTYYYPFLTLHVETNDTTKSLETISRDYKQLGTKAKELGAQVVCFFIQQWKVLEVNHWFKE